MSAVLEVDDNTFQAEVLDSEIPVLVDFWAPWCGPCRALAPTVDAVAKDYAGRVKVVKLNLDNSQAIAAKYNVFQIPTLLLFKSGKPVEHMLGLQPKPRISEKLDAHL